MTKNTIFFIFALSLYAISSFSVETAKAEVPGPIIDCPQNFEWFAKWLPETFEGDRCRVAVTNEPDKITVTMDVEERHPDHDQPYSPAEHITLDVRKGADIEGKFDYGRCRVYVNGRSNMFEISRDHLGPTVVLMSNGTWAVCERCGGSGRCR